MLFEEDLDDEGYFEDQAILSENDLYGMKVRLAEINSEIEELNRKSSIRLEAYRPVAIFVGFLAGIGAFFSLIFLALNLGVYFGTAAVTLMFLAPDPFVSLAVGACVYSKIGKKTAMNRYQELEDEKKEIERVFKQYYGYVPKVEQYKTPDYLG